MLSSRTRSFIAGVLVGNSAPHLATAVTGHRHLTPLAGRDSGPGVNGAVGRAQPAGGAPPALPRPAPAPGSWNGDLVAFETGVLAVAAWMAGSERLLGTNTRP